MERTAVGIDLGTSYSSVAVADGERVQILADDRGETLQPSVVWFPEKGAPLVGAEAKTRLINDPDNTVYSSKRLIGRKWNEPAVNHAKANFTYEVIEGPGGQPVARIRNQLVTMPEISALILRHMRGIAEKRLGRPVQDAVITVPANFNDAQREATRIAGQIAGLNVLRMINEPTAAALAFGYKRGYNATVAVYDFGGGTFDFTLLDIRDRVFRVVFTAGDTMLGGDDLDQALATHLARKFWEATKIELQKSAAEWQRLLFSCEKAKCALTNTDSAVVDVPRVASRDRQWLDLHATLTRASAHALWVDYMRRTLDVCRQAMDEAHKTLHDVDDLLLIGGTTYLPLVRATVEHFFQRRPRGDVEPRTAVAVGAAIHAHSLVAPASPDPATASALLLDVLPLSIGIATAGGFMEKIIERGTHLPVEQTRVFSTSYDGQQDVRVKIYQGESKKVAENTPIGELVMTGLRPAPRGTISIHVMFEVDTSGILNVSAVDQDSGRQITQRVKISGEIPPDQLGDLGRRFR